MTRLSRLWKLLLALGIMAPIVGVLPVQAAGRLHRAVRAPGPQSYYLSLGDSLAYGYQPFGPLRQGFGFSDFLASGLERINPDLQPVNLACPGENSATFIKGGCPNTVAVSYQGSQLNAALTFLKAHRGQVSPITYVLGASDILPLLKAASPTQIQAAIQQFAVNDNTILAQLRQAAPAADIVTIDYYQPLAVAVTSTAALSDVIQVTQLGNAIIDQTAARYNVKVANVYAAFNSPPQSPLLCNLTWICSPYHDIHPMIAGYEIMAELIGAALGYPGLASTTPTNPLAVARGALVSPAVITWMWIGDTNAQGYDVIVFHYDTSGQMIQDRSVTAPAGAPIYTLVGATCGITYELKVRTRGPNRPSAYVGPGDGRMFRCPAS